MCVCASLSLNTLGGTVRVVMSWDNATECYITPPVVVAKGKGGGGVGCACVACATAPQPGDENNGSDGCATVVVHPTTDAQQTDTQTLERKLFVEC